VISHGAAASFLTVLTPVGSLGEQPQKFKSVAAPIGFFQH
jgi:hypothetical protein